jgi:hypothetical protein
VGRKFGGLFGWEIMDRAQQRLCKNMFRISASAANGTAESEVGK